jgi:hypothetical protein
MQDDALDQLAHLESQASAAPWRVVQLDDEHCMSMVAITNHETPMGNAEWASWDGAQVLAATLVQQPAYVVPEDRCWHENAALMVAVRNHLPELIRLARLGREAEAVAD